MGCERNNHADPEFSGEGEGGDSPAARGERAGCPPEPMEVNGGAEIPLQPVEDPMPEQVAGPGEGRDSVGKPTLEQFVKDCSLWEELALEKLAEG